MPLAILEVLCVVIYLTPRTSVLGAILLTGYIGGAIYHAFAVGDPFVLQIALGIFVWLGLYLRESRPEGAHPVANPLVSSILRQLCTAMGVTRKPAKRSWAIQRTTL